MTSNFASRKRSRTLPLLHLVDEVEELSASQRSVLDAVSDRRHVFVTGRAGCGKSKTIRTLIKCLEAAGTPFAVAAPTGIAAEQIGGCTLHSLLGLNDDMSVADCIKRAKRYKKAALAPLQVVIVDEISMVSAETFGKCVSILQAFHTPLPVLVLAGDFLQLPPVQGSVLLDSAEWATLNPHLVVLNDCFRQEEGGSFMKVLDEARLGALTDESVKLLEARVDAPLDAAEGLEPTVLMSRRVGVDDLNRKRLSELAAPVRQFCASVYDATRVETTWIPERGLSADVPEDLTALPSALQAVNVKLPRDRNRWMDAAALVQSSNMPSVLHVAVGAQVVFVANVNPPQIVNGTRGVVTDFDAEGFPVVKLVSGAKVTARPWQRARPLTKSRAMPCMVYEQVPLQLAWALTIHKSQGMTLDLAQIDIGSGVFSEGQAYVALSRMRSMEGMSLLRFHAPSVRANSAVVEWYRSHSSEIPAVCSKE